MSITTAQEEEILRRGRLGDELASHEGFLLFATEFLDNASTALFNTSQEQREEREKLYQQHAAICLLFDTVKQARTARDVLSEELTRRTDEQLPQRPSEFHSEREELN